MEGSTRLLQELGDGYVQALTEHRRALRESFARHGGVEVDTQGDAFFVAFARASEALAAAVEGRDALIGGPIRVRMGLHTGEPLLTEEGYAGIDVHRAARIAAAGHGGQILVSRSTHDLVGPDGLRDLGEHRLKDLTARERIYQLGADDFPPLKSLNATNLPVAANPLVGRERELVELLALLRDSRRLVTLTGVGGSGKTRLALQVAAELLEDFPGGVFFVALAEVGSPDLVEATIARTVGVRELADLRDRKVLLLVDNFEHLLEGATTIGQVLSATSAAKVLTTSRAPLRLSGEHEYRLDPLPASDALELLTQRARAVRRDFEPTPAAVEICLRLDGLPLALELAASRLRSLGSESLLARLAERLPMLTSSRRDAPARQRTLRATIEWSYDLLPAELRGVFARLSVFAGAFALESAETVAEAAFEDLDALVEASLLKPAGDDRFLMLETIREYAAERLVETNARAELERRHAHHYVEVAKWTNLSEEAEGRKPQHELAVAELPNFRKALGWSIDAAEAEPGLQLITYLEQFWVAQAPFEGRRWVEQLLEGSGSISPELRARALLTYGGLVFIVGEFERGSEIYEQSLAAYRMLGDERGAASVLNRMIYAAITEEDFAKARVIAEESLAAHRRFGSTRGEAVALGSLADVEWQTGNEELAIRLAEHSAQLAGSAGFDWWRAGQLTLLCKWSLARGQLREAEHLGREALEVAHRTGDRMHRTYVLAMLARCAAEDGRLERAGLLWAGVEVEEQDSAIGQWEDEREAYAAPVLAYAGSDFERGRTRGRTMTPDEVVEAALGEA